MADGLFGYLPADQEGEDEKNTFCRAGALRLKAKIEAYWAERGKHVRVEAGQRRLQSRRPRRSRRHP